MRNNYKGRAPQKRIKEEGLMVHVSSPDQFEKAMRRFKRKVEAAGVIRECRERQEYVKPSTRRKLAKAAGRARWLRKLKKMEQL